MPRPWTPADREPTCKSPEQHRGDRWVVYEYPTKIQIACLGCRLDRKTPEKREAANKAARDRRAQLKKQSEQPVAVPPLPTAAIISDWASPNKEVYRLEVARIYSRYAPPGLLVILPGERATEVDHYTIGRETPISSIVAIEKDPDVVDKIRKRHPSLRVLEHEARYAFQDIDESSTGFVHLDMMCCVEENGEKELTKTIRALFQSNILVPKAVIVVNVINGRTKVLDRVDQVGLIIQRYWPNARRLKNDKYGLMIWSAWQI